MKTEQLKRLFPDLSSGIYVMMLCIVAAMLVMPIALSSMSIGLLFLSWLVTNPWKRFGNLKQNRVGLALMGFYALYVIGLLYSTDQGQALKELEYKLSFLLFPLIITTGPVLTKRQFRLVLLVFVAAVMALCLSAIGIGLSHGFSAELDRPFISYFTYRELSTSVGFDPIYMALYIILAIFILVEEQLLCRSFERIRPTHWLTWPILTLFLLTLIFLSSRMEILVFISMTGLLMVSWAWKSGKWKLPLAIAVLVPLLSVGLISVNDVNKERFTEMVDLEEDYTENKWGGRSIRVEKWKNALECWSASPVIGVGSGDVMDELMKVYERNEFQLAFDNYFNPHNQYLQVAITFGIIGLLYLLWLFWQLIGLSLRTQDWLLMIFTLTMVLSIVTESMFERQKGAVFFVFFAMVLSARAIWRQEKPIGVIEKGEGLDS